MSRTRTRARRRRAAEAEALSHVDPKVFQFNVFRADPERFEMHLKAMARSSEAIWPVAVAADRLKPLSEEERFMIAQAVNPVLAASTSNAADKRHMTIKPPAKRLRTR